MSPAIEARSLSKSFGDVLAVDGVHITVHQGEMFGIVGPDGAGKTTLIRLLCGILTPTAGTATVLDHDILRQSEVVKREIGYLPQRFSLYGDLTVDENIEFFAEINKVYSYKQRREELLAFTRLVQSRKVLAEQLSGGMKQKLALACTLIHTPRLLLLDEPTTGVDPVSRRDFWRILQSLLESGITIVMSTPYLDEAERCARVALMNNGTFMSVDSPRGLKNDMKGDIVEIVCSPVRDAFVIVKELMYVREVQAFGDKLNVIVDDAKQEGDRLKEALLSRKITITNWRVIPPSLENVFISLMTRLLPNTVQGEEFVK
jgi:ABC-2 type transport system ATP-binding protein